MKFEELYLSNVLGVSEPRLNPDNVQYAITKIVDQVNKHSEMLNDLEDAANYIQWIRNNHPTIVDEYRLVVEAKEKLNGV